MAAPESQFFDRFSMPRFLRHQINKAFLSAPSEKATPTSPIDFLSFPPEIRNQITDFILKPGHIHFPKANEKDKSSYPGFQLLAANHQTYSEGRLQFYSDNMFHLPAGLIRHTEQAFAQYQPKHLALIRRVTIDCGIHDLADASMLSVLQDNTREGLRGVLGLHPVFDYIHGSRELPRIWIDKLLFVRDHFPNIEELHVNFSDLREIPWKNGSYDKKGYDKQSDVYFETETWSHRLNTDFSVNGTVDIVLKGQNIQDEIRGLPVNLEDYEPPQTNGFSLLPFAIAFAAERAHDEVHAWVHAVEDWDGMLRNFEEVAELQERKLQFGEHKGALYTPQILRSLCPHGLHEYSCPYCQL